MSASNWAFPIRNIARSRCENSNPSPQGEIQVDGGAATLTIPIGSSPAGGAEALVVALGKLSAADVRVVDAALRKPTLDDVFLTLTGHEADDRKDSAQ